MSHIYMHPDVEAARVRAMVEKKRELDAAEEAHDAAKQAYLRAIQELTGSFPRGHDLGPYVCGDLYIHDMNGGVRQEIDRFSYTQVKRIPTSE